MTSNGPPKHAITIDVEDWYQSTVDPNVPLSDRFVASTEKVLEVLAQRQVRGTFFVLGLAAEKAPRVIRRIAQGGHEVQSHGYGHVEVFKLTEGQFRNDLTRAKAILEDRLGGEIFGYRAPSFSVDHRTPWAWDVLAETGHRYDSSVFPMRMRRYGIKGHPLGPQIVTTRSGRPIVEAPVACFHVLGRRLPCAGGGYARLLPKPLLRAAWRQVQRQGRPGVFYMHPYEYDPTEMSAHSSSVSWKTRLVQGLGRKGFAAKVNMLLDKFCFTTLGDVLEPWLKELP